MISPKTFRDLIRIGFTNLEGKAFMDVPEDFDALMNDGLAERVPNDFGMCLLKITPKGHKEVMEALDGIAWKNIIEAKHPQS